MGIKTKAALIGTTTTAVLLVLAFWLDSIGHRQIGQALIWQSGFLQSFIPCLNIGTVERPLCEGTPLNLFAFIASIPFAACLYTFAAYIGLRLLRRRS